MKVLKLIVERTYAFPKFENEKHAVEIEIPPGATIEEAYQKAHEELLKIFPSRAVIENWYSPNEISQAHTYASKPEILHEPVIRPRRKKTEVDLSTDNQIQENPEDDFGQMRSHDEPPFPKIDF